MSDLATIRMISLRAACRRLDRMPFASTLSRPLSCIVVGSGELSLRPSLELASHSMQAIGMKTRSILKRFGFWSLALLWLPSCIVGQAAVRFPLGSVLPLDLGSLLPRVLDLTVSLLPVAVFGLPLALGCRRLWRQGRRNGSVIAGIGLGAVTTIVSLGAGLLGPVAIAVAAVVLSLPVWIASWWLTRRGSPAGASSD